MIIGGGGENIKYDKTIRVNGKDMTFSFSYFKVKVMRLLTYVLSRHEIIRFPFIYFLQQDF